MEVINIIISSCEQRQLVAKYSLELISQSEVRNRFRNESADHVTFNLLHQLNLEAQSRDL